MRRCMWPTALVLALVALVVAAVSAGGPLAAARAADDAPAQAADANPAAIARMAANVAVSPYADDVYAAYEFSKFLERPLFNTMGEPKGFWDTPTMHYGASAVAVNPESGYTWAAFRRLGRMELDRFNEIGRSQDTWKTGYTGHPASMSVNRLGDVSVLVNSTAVNGHKADILTFIDDGTLQDMKSTTFDTPATAVVRDGDGLTFVTADATDSAGVVRKLDRDGFLDAEWATAIRPLAITLGPEDVLVAGVEPGTSNGAVQRFGLDGSNVGQWRVGGVPLSIALGPDESVYVLVQPTAGLSLTIEKRTLDGRMLLRWSVISTMFLPWLSPGA